MRDKKYYKLDERITIQEKLTLKGKERYLRLEVLDRLATLKEELEEMTQIIKEDEIDEDKEDEEILTINERIKELEQQIVKIIS